jgi:hypothetical protein
MFPIGSTSNSQQNSSYKIGNKLHFELLLEFLRGSNFLKKSDKFSKIPCLLDKLEYNFKLTHLYSKFGSFFTSDKNNLVKFILKIAGHLGMLGPLTQVHHWSKFDKECSKLSYIYCHLIRLTCLHHPSNSNKICNFQKW